MRRWLNRLRRRLAAWLLRGLPVERPLRAYQRETAHYVRGLVHERDSDQIRRAAWSTPINNLDPDRWNTPATFEWSAADVGRRAGVDKEDTVRDRISGEVLELNPTFEDEVVTEWDKPSLV